MKGFLGRRAGNARAKADKSNGGKEEQEENMVVEVLVDDESTAGSEISSTFSQGDQSDMVQLIPARPKPPPLPPAAASHTQPPKDSADAENPNPPPRTRTSSSTQGLNFAAARLLGLASKVKKKRTLRIPTQSLGQGDHSAFGFDSSLPNSDGLDEHQEAADPMADAFAESGHLSQIQDERRASLEMMAQLFETLDLYAAPPRFSSSELETSHIESGDPAELGDSAKKSSARSQDPRIDVWSPYATALPRRKELRIKDGKDIKEQPLPATPAFRAPKLEFAGSRRRVAQDTQPPKAQNVFESYSRLAENVGQILEALQEKSPHTQRPSASGTQTEAVSLWSLRAQNRERMKRYGFQSAQDIQSAIQKEHLAIASKSRYVRNFEMTAVDRVELQKTRLKADEEVLAQRLVEHDQIRRDCAEELKGIAVELKRREEANDRLAASIVARKTAIEATRASLMDRIDQYQAKVQESKHAHHHKRQQHSPQTGFGYPISLPHPGPEAHSTSQSTFSGAAMGVPPVPGPSRHWPSHSPGNGPEPLPFHSNSVTNSPALEAARQEEGPHTSRYTNHQTRTAQASPHATLPPSIRTMGGSISHE